jgi:hypothetical protein
LALSVLIDGRAIAKTLEGAGQVVGRREPRKRVDQYDVARNMAVNVAGSDDGGRFMR